MRALTKKKILVLLFITALFSSLMVQERCKRENIVTAMMSIESGDPWTWLFTFTDVSYDEVWKATTQTLFFKKWRLGEIEDPVEFVKSISGGASDEQAVKLKALSDKELATKLKPGMSIAEFRKLCDDEIAKFRELCDTLKKEGIVSIHKVAQMDKASGVIVATGCLLNAVPDGNNTWSLKVLVSKEAKNKVIKLTVVKEGGSGWEEQLRQSFFETMVKQLNAKVIEEKSN
jgi:hypothetical protein